MNLWAWNSEENIRKSRENAQQDQIPEEDQKRPLETPKTWITAAHSLNKTKMKFPSYGNEEIHSKNAQGGSQPLSIAQIEFLAMGKMKETTKTWGRIPQLSLAARGSKRMGE